MRFEQLYYLVEVARVGSISLAAERLYVSQPSISQSITNLEKELGVKLLDRSRHGAHPTDTGEIVISKAKEILKKVEELKLAVSSENSLLTGNLSVAVLPSICITLLPKTLAVYKNKYPKVNLTIKEEGSVKVIQDVQSGKTDIGIVAAAPDNQSFLETLDREQIGYEKLFFNEVMACVGKPSPLSLNVSITFAEIINHPIVTYNSQYNMHTFITNQLRKYGDPKIMFTSDNTEITRKIIAEGIAVGFNTELTLRIDPYVIKGEIIPLQITDGPMRVAYFWIHSKRHHFPITGVRFIDELKNQRDIWGL